MSEAWYSEVADELARLLTDARHCAESCEQLLVSLDGRPVDRTLVNAVVGPAAVSRVLIDLIDQPQQLVHATATLCREMSLDAARKLAALPEATGTVEALRRCAESCAALLEAL